MRVLLLAAALPLLPVSSTPSDLPGTLVPLRTGVRVYVETVGNGPEAVVIPMGSWLSDSFRALASPRRTLYLYDTRGRGRSEPVDPSRVSLANELADLDALRRHYRLDRMALVGWSHYGMMTAVYALRHPERVVRLIQMTPAPPRSDPFLEQEMAAIRSRVLPQEWNELEARRKSGVFGNDRAAECRAANGVLRRAYFGDFAANRRMTFDECAWDNELPENTQKFFAALLSSMGKWDYRTAARKLDVPRLVVHGAVDFIPMESSREWAAGSPSARLLVLPGVGHHPFVERPDLFFPAADRFLSGGWPEGAQVVPAGR